MYVLSETECRPVTTKAAGRPRGGPGGALAMDREAQQPDGGWRGGGGSATVNQSASTKCERRSRDRLFALGALGALGAQWPRGRRTTGTLVLEAILPAHGSIRRRSSLPTPIAMASNDVARGAPLGAWGCSMPCSVHAPRCCSAAAI